MQLVRYPNPLRTKARTPFLKHREHSGVILGDDDRGVAVKGCHARRGSSVKDIRFAAAAARQLTDSGCCGAWNIKHDFAAATSHWA